MKSGWNIWTKKCLSLDNDLKSIAVILRRNCGSQEISAGEIRQVGLENFEAGELEAEIGQQAKASSTAKSEQTGATGVKVQGKATIKIKQNFE